MTALNFAQQDRTRSVLDEIEDERFRQITKEGWTVEHDDEHARGEMSAAASCYAANACLNVSGEPSYATGHPPTAWMWGAEWWKPQGARRDLIRAAALIVAEIERIDRSPPAPPIQSSDQGDLGDAAKSSDETRLTEGKK